MANKKKVVKFQKPGVLDEIEKQLVKAKEIGGIEVPQLVKKLSKKFPERDPDSMTLTVRTQVSGRRLQQTRGLRIKTKRDGNTVKYYAPAPSKKAA